MPPEVHEQHGEIIDSASELGVGAAPALLRVERGCVQLVRLGQAACRRVALLVWAGEKATGRALWARPEL